MWKLLVALAALAAQGQDRGYIEPVVCARCHQQIYDSYRQTGMGRSFYRANAESTVEDYQVHNTYYHQPSGRYYTMYTRAGRYYQRRHQIGPDGREWNVVEKEIHYVLGSGNHSRTYLHKTEGGQLEQLPVGWYAERGGFWAMNPGYDRPDHLDFRRKIDQECFFCHNAYPQIQPGLNSGQRELVLPGAIPEGIDCQRCHGPGGRHVQSAQAGEPLDRVRAAILNPRSLSAEGQLELCLQCHLESTSHRLPYSLRRHGRGFFSYRAGEPLGNYILHFDHAPGAGYDDKFEIVHSAYRFLKSACYLNSNNALTCTTCHNPHEPSRGKEPGQRYIQICRNCHAPALARLVAAAKHTSSDTCVECHMPKRRTEDAVHVVMTDHYIARHKPEHDLLAPRRETHDSDSTAYRGEVVLLYPREAPAKPETMLYLAVAQVIDGANLKAGIPRLENLIKLYRPQQAEFSFELANAYFKAGRNDKALTWYEEALRMQPRFMPARLGYATALTKAGRPAAAANVLEPQPETTPQVAQLHALGSAYLDVGRVYEAITAFQRALAADPELPEIYVNLGTALSRKGDQNAAVDAFRNAIRLAPDFAAAHNNLASILSQRGNFEQARQFFQEAIRLDPSYAEVHYNYGRALANVSMLELAERELNTALRLNPKLAEAAVSLGLVLARKAQWEAAIEQYRRAVQIKPDLMPAHFNLGLALMRQAKNAEAKVHFETVIRSTPNDFEAHYHLATILLNEGATNAARLHLEKALESPNPELRTAAQNAMRQSKR